MSDHQYGPGGYLPERAARRARKIVLREPLGRGWIVASLVGAVLIAVLGVAYAVTQGGPPGDPYRDAGSVDAIDPRGAATVDVDGEGFLVLRGAGGIQVFEDPGVDADWCRESRRLEAADGRVWDHTGVLRGGGGQSLRPVPAEAHEGRLYLDPSAALSRPAPRPSGEEPVCR